MPDADPAVPALPTTDPDRETQLTELEGKLDVRLRDRRLLNLALQHGSFGHGGGGRRESYERLELLGDAVLSLVVCDHLYHRYSDAPEGELAKLRARIVSEPWLARIAQSLDLGRYILLGKGEEKAGGRHRPAVLADVLEAVLRAVYFGFGLGAVPAAGPRVLQGALDGLALPAGGYQSTVQGIPPVPGPRPPKHR